MESKYIFTEFLILTYLSFLVFFNSSCGLELPSYVISFLQYSFVPKPCIVFLCEIYNISICGRLNNIIILLYGIDFCINQNKEEECICIYIAFYNYVITFNMCFPFVCIWISAESLNFNLKNSFPIILQGQ